VTEWRSATARRHCGIAGRRVAPSILGARRCAREEDPMNRDEIKGKAEKAKGYVKEKAGELLNDPELQTEGEIDRAKGTVRETVGRAKRKAKDGVEEIVEEVESE
jgi:uncharacterized protein YjbJ (UPF0337 family)